MKIQSRASVVLAKTLMLLFVLIMVTLFLMKPPLTSSTVRPQGERMFENAIPENAPIRINIKKEKEKSFRERKDEKWVEEFELEVKNVGDKPIYFIYINLTSDVELSGGPLIFPLVYGRAELGDIITKAGPDDPFIKPGETYVLKIHPGNIQGWETSVREKSHPDALRIKARIQMLSYGDGTGYFVDGPYPLKDKRRSALDDPMQRPNKGEPDILTWPVGQRPSPITSSIFDLPAMFLPANFLSWDWWQKTQESAAPNENCGLFDYCVGIIPFSGIVCYNCPPQNRPGFSSAGPCVELSYGSIECSADARRISVKLSASRLAVLARDLPQRPHRRQFPFPVSIA